MPKTITRQVAAKVYRRGPRRLSVDQVRDLAIIHVLTLDEIANGRATEETLWELIGMVLLWSRVAQLLALGEAEMAPQMDLATTLLHRYRQTRCVFFQGRLEYDVARIGTIVMDQLAAAVDQATATEASVWGEQQINARRYGQAHAVPVVALGATC